jgi:phospholipid/cholesterol/gamma-HCH transport system substrate-binding protein
METRANYIVVGLFTFAVVAAAFGFVFWFHHTAGKGVASVYRVVFDGSVSGLRAGSSVLFNGIRVGEVTKLDLNPDNPGQVIALIAVNKSTPVRADTRVGLDFQGVTGVASVSLKGGTQSQPPLEAQAGGAGEPPTLMAGQSATEDLTQSVRNVLNNANALILENQAALREAIGNISIFAATLARNSDRVDHILAETEEATRSIRTLSENLDKRTAEITLGLNRLTAAGTKQVDALGVDAHRTLGNIDRAVTDLAHNPQRLLFGGTGTAAGSTATIRR